MFDWKIIVTVIILLGIIAFFISTQTPVQEFFKSIKDSILSFLGYTVVEERNVSFSITTEYDSISFKDEINITIHPIIFSANTSDMSIETSDIVNMDFSGSGKIAGRTLVLDGTTNKIEIANSSMTFNKASVKAETTFTKLTIDDLELRELKISSGSLFVKGTEIKFSGSVVIYNPEGRFEFQPIDAEGVNVDFEEGVGVGFEEVYKLKAEGFASRISIPESDIVID